jgi:hypothetical protein
MQPSFRLVGLDAVLSGEQRIQYQFIARTQFRRHRAMRDVEDLISAIRTVLYESP